MAVTRCQNRPAHRIVDRCRGDRQRSHPRPVDVQLDHDSPERRNGRNRDGSRHEERETDPRTGQAELVVHDPAEAKPEGEGRENSHQRHGKNRPFVLGKVTEIEFETDWKHHQNQVQAG